jgi:two-component system, NtrC family, sensor kinase
MVSEKKLTKKIAIYKDELDKKGRILSSIYKINHIANRSTNPDQILKTILHESQKIFGFTRAIILLLNKAENKLETKYCIGFTPEEEEFSFSHPLDMDKHICMETLTVKTDKTIYIKDIETYARSMEVERKMVHHWKRVSNISAPLRINRQVIGSIGGDRIDQEMNLSRSDIRLFTYFANMASMILEHVHLYEQILKEKNIAQNILESVPNGILAIDEHKMLWLINRKAEEIMKLKRRKVLEKKISDILSGKIRTMLYDTIDHHITHQYEEVESQRRDGQNKIYGATSSAMYGPQGNFTGAIMTIQDLTESKKTESMLRRTENLSSLGQMSASIAHEIRNPLASINFNVQLLSKKIKADPFVQPILTDTLEGIDRIKMVMKRTLDYTKVLNTSLAAGQIESVLADAISLVLPELRNHNIEITKGIVGPIPAILFDSHQIQQVFVNLLLNAVEAMPRGGVITITGKMEENIYSNENDYFLITIRDNGVGIPSENIKRIFDPFFTTKKEGTGLGLSIVHKILGQHGATIDVKGRENRGTNFYVRFPVIKRGA